MSCFPSTNEPLTQRKTSQKQLVKINNVFQVATSGNLEPSAFSLFSMYLPSLPRPPPLLLFISLGQRPWGKRGQPLATQDRYQRCH